MIHFAIQWQYIIQGKDTGRKTRGRQGEDKGTVLPSYFPGHWNVKNKTRGRFFRLTFPGTGMLSKYAGVIFVM